MFEWFIDVRGVMKGSLPKNLFVVKAMEMYQDWLKQQPHPPKQLLQFSNQWINEWMKEYGVISDTMQIFRKIDPTIISYPTFISLKKNVTPTRLFGGYVYSVL